MDGNVIGAQARVRRIVAAPVAALLVFGALVAAATAAGADPLPTVTGTGICFGYPGAGGCELGFGGTGSARAGSAQLLGAIVTATDGVADGEQIVLDGTGTGVTFPSTANSYQVQNGSTSTGCGNSGVTVDSDGERAFVTMPTGCVASFNQKVIVFVNNFGVPSTTGTFALFLSTTHDYNPVGTNTLSVVDVPSAPQSPSASRNNGSIDVSWSAPSDTNGSDVTGYNVYCSDTTPSTSDAPSATTDGSTLTANIGGLTAHTSYSCIVTAVNDAGESAPSDAVSATPYEVAGAPTSFVSTRGNKSITLSWDRPTDIGGTPITAYNVYCSSTDVPMVDPGDLCATFGPSRRSGVLRGLTNGVTYNVAMTAVNLGGESGLTDVAQTTPATVPSRPRLVRVKPFHRSLSLHWKAPAKDGGDAITQYEVFCNTDDPFSPGNTASATVTTTAANLSHLISGTPWHCVVVADNTVGSSVQSLVVTATPT